MLEHRSVSGRLSHGGIRCRLVYSFWMMELLHNLMWFWSLFVIFEVLVVLKCGGGVFYGG